MSSAKSGKLIGVGALIVVAVIGLVYSVSTYSGGDTITPVTEASDGRATVRKLTCSKCGYEEEVTSAEYNERLSTREDPNKWLECPKCHENAVQRASSGKPFGGPAPPDSTAGEAPAEEQAVDDMHVAPEVRTRSRSPGS